MGYEMSLVERQEVLEQLRVYWNKGTENDADYFTRHNTPIQNFQMRPWYIHTLNLVRTIPQTIQLREVVLNRVLVNQFRIEFLKVI